MMQNSRTRSAMFDGKHYWPIFVVKPTHSYPSTHHWFQDSLFNSISGKVVLSVHVHITYFHDIMLTTVRTEVNLGFWFENGKVTKKLYHAPICRPLL